MERLNAWGVGNVQRNDEVMLVVAVKDRETRIALGSGYRAQYDGLAKQIIDSDILPAFRAGRMEDGIIAGTRSSLERLRLDIDLPPETLGQRFTRYIEEASGFFSSLWRFWPS